MLFLAILQHYLVWHYLEAYKEIFVVWRNMSWFVFHYFSLAQLTKTLFAPWKRITEEKRKSWDFEDFAGRVIVNLISRLIGAIMRLVVISVGLICLCLTLAAAAATYLLWFVAPLVIVASFIIGLVYIII